MLVRVIWTAYGRAAVSVLCEQIREFKAGDPLHPVTVVVPSNPVGVSVRRLVASGEVGFVHAGRPGLVATDFVTLHKVAEHLGGPRAVGAGRHLLTPPVLAAAIRSVLRDRHGFFAPVAEHPATMLALASACRELRDLSGDALDRLAAAGTRASEVVRIHHSAREILADSFFDQVDLLESACAELDGERGAAIHLGDVVLFLPWHLSRHEAGFVSVLGRHTRVCVVAGGTGDLAADSEVIDAIRAINSNTMDIPTGIRVPETTPERTRIVTTPDAQEEVRQAVWAVVDAARRGVHLDRIAVLYGAQDPYARLVREHLECANISCNGEPLAPVSTRMAGRTLLGLTRLGKGTWSRADLFAWLSGAPLRHSGREVPVDAWESVARGAWIVGGRDQWDRRLSAFIDEHDAEPVTADGLPGESESSREAEAARALRAFVLDLIDDVAAARVPRRWSEHAEWARTRLTSLLGEEWQRVGWPDDEQRAADRVMGILDSLATVDAVEGPVDFDVFASSLELELKSETARHGHMGDGVLVGPIASGVGMDFDLVVMLGLAEGTCPGPVRDDSILPDDERRVAGEHMALRSHEPERQYRQFLANLGSARHHLLCVPRGDLRRSDVRVPSRWVADITSHLAGRRLTCSQVLDTQATWIDHVASFDAGLRSIDFPASEQEHRLRFLIAQAASPHDPGRKGAPDDPVLSAGIETDLSRRRDAFTRFDGNLAGLAIPSPVATIVSATRLEEWAACPFAYFARRILGVEPVENPEDRLQITPLNRGSLIHEILERFITEVVSLYDGQNPVPGQSWTEADRSRIRSIAEKLCDEYERRGAVGRPIFWRRDRRRILADLDRFLSEDSAHRAEMNTYPVAAELTFGFDRAPLAAVEIGVPDGRVLHFRGKADRLDVASDGTLEVIDYKTGGSEGYKDLSEDNADRGGTMLQLPVYALAARLHQGRPDAHVHSAYWFVTAREGFRRVGFPVSERVLDRIRLVLGMIVKGIEEGVFPQHPIEKNRARGMNMHVECAYCDPDGLGVVELCRQVGRKVADPALETYVSLAASNSTTSMSGDGTDAEGESGG